MKIEDIGRLLIGSAILTVLFGLLNIVLGCRVSPDYYLLSLGANCLVNIVIMALVRNAWLKGMYLLLFIFIVYFIVGQFNVLVEAYLFDVSTRAETIRELIRGFLAVGIFSPVAVFLYRDPNTIPKLEFSYPSKLNWIWKFFLGDVLYLLLYMLAGMMLVAFFPKLLDFYSENIPPIGLIILTQLCLRGPIFVLVAVLILKYINLPVLKKSVLVGLTFSILGGVAPLIPTNELMPGFVRFGHLFEVGISNFLLGLLLGLLFGQRSVLLERASLE